MMEHVFLINIFKMLILKKIFEKLPSIQRSLNFQLLMYQTRDFGT